MWIRLGSKAVPARNDDVIVVCKETEELLTLTVQGVLLRVRPGQPHAVIQNASVSVHAKTAMQYLTSFGHVSPVPFLLLAERQQFNEATNPDVQEEEP